MSEMSLYELYNLDLKVGEYTIEELVTKFRIPESKLKQYISKGLLIHGKYLVRSKNRGNRTLTDAEFIKQWNQAIERLRR